MKNNNSKKKISIITICLLLTVVVSIGGTLAYIITSTPPVENIFTSSKVGNYVAETVEEVDDVWVKKNVSIVNNIGGQEGDTAIVDAYVRAMVVVNWKTEDNKIIPAKSNEYHIKLCEDTGWDLDTSDGYYYYTSVVKPDESTGFLISEVKPLVAAPTGYTVNDGYSLSVEIISQSIQAQPISVVQDKWHVTVNGTTISK